MGKMDELFDGADHNYYPAWVCSSCGAKYGRRRCRTACWHVGTCGICGIEASVTEPRDFGHLQTDWRDVGMPNSRSLLQALQQVANEVGQQCASDKRVLDDLAQLVARLARALRKAAPDNELAVLALDYLQREGLCGSPLREAPNAGAEPRSEAKSASGNLLARTATD